MYSFPSFRSIISSLVRRVCLTLILALAASPAPGALASTAPGTAQTPYLVLDINPDSAESMPGELVYARSPAFTGLLFSADDGQHGQELWQSDGQQGGALLLKDINPGPEPSDPSLLTDLEGTVFFRADDGRHGAELWKSDGTPQGTSLVRDINDGSDHAYPSHLVAVGGTLFFRASDGEHGYELWASDGSRGGTRLVRDILPGGGGSSPQHLVAASGDGFQGVFFWADDGTHGIELWRSDGTEAGTHLLKDIAPGFQDSGPGAMASLEGPEFQGLLFAADDGSAGGTYGEELWRSDGTAAGTTLVKDINPGPGGSQPGALTAARQSTSRAVFFGARDGDQGHGYELWRSDGTPGGTLLVRDINPGAADSNPCHLTALSGSRFDGLLFCADDGAHGAELWRSDGTTGGTSLVQDINPGPGGSALNSLRGVWTRVYFSADDGAAGHGAELWASDATPGGTALVADLNPGSAGAYPALLTSSAGPHRWHLFFRADDGSHGRELWAMELSAVQYLPLLMR